MKRLIGSLVLAMVLAACGSDSKKSSSTAPAKDTNTKTTTAGDATLGKVVFTNNCKTCHGADGKNASYGNMSTATAAKIASCTASGCVGSTLSMTMAAVPLSATDLANVQAYVTEKLAKGLQ